MNEHFQLIDAGKLQWIAKVYDISFLWFTSF